MQEVGLSERHTISTGYGCGDIGKEAIEKVYSIIFNTEDTW